MRSKRLPELPRVILNYASILKLLKKKYVHILAELAGVAVVTVRNGIVKYWNWNVASDYWLSARQALHICKFCLLSAAAKGQKLIIRSKVGEMLSILLNIV